MAAISMAVQCLAAECLNTCCGVYLMKYIAADRCSRQSNGQAAQFLMLHPLQKLLQGNVALHVQV